MSPLPHPLIVHLCQLQGGERSWSAQLGVEGPIEAAGLKVAAFYQGRLCATALLDEWGYALLELADLAPPLNLTEQVHFEVRSLAPPQVARSESFHPPLVLSALREHIETHRAWPRQLPLRGAQLQRVTLSQADLSGVDLRGADLTSANLKGANLEGAILKECKLTEADLTGADLSGADLSGAHIHGARLDDALCSGADFRGVRGMGLRDLHRLADLIIMDERQMKALALTEEREVAAPAPLAAPPPAAPPSAAPPVAASAPPRPTPSPTLAGHRPPHSPIQTSHYAGTVAHAAPARHATYLSGGAPQGAGGAGAAGAAGAAGVAGGGAAPHEKPAEVKAARGARERERAAQLARYAQHRVVRGDLSFDLVLIPEGEAWLGRDDGDPAARPRHRVRITRPFFLGVTPVTQALYTRLMGETRFKFPHPDAPADSVSWLDAVELCNRLSQLERLEPAYDVSLKGGVRWRRDAQGYRLPTEAEWEHAARAHNTYLYAGGDQLDPLGWYDANSEGRTHPVRQRAPNDWGLYDMSGNVWEWCFDTFKDTAYQARAAEGAVAEDPAVEGEGQRVLRGGSWSYEAEGAELSFRSRLAPHFKTSRIGFRLARTPRLQQR